MFEVIVRIFWFIMFILKCTEFVITNIHTCMYVTSVHTFSGLVYHVYSEMYRICDNKYTYKYIFVYEDTLGIAVLVKILNTIQNEHVGAYTTLRAYVSISRCAT